MKFSFALALICLIAGQTKAPAQNLGYVKALVDTLCADSLHGRGYVNQGGKKAANFVAAQFRQYGLQPYGDSYFQPFSHPVNTFSGKISLSVDGKLLRPGLDYQVKPSSPAIAQKGLPLVRLDAATAQSWSSFKKWKRKNDVADACLLVAADVHLKIDPKVGRYLSANKLGAACIIQLTPNKLTWSVAQQVDKTPTVEVVDSIFPANAQKVDITIEQSRISYQNQNVLAWLPGKSDSFICITAHYDHLGRMGKEAIFPGANDNASGTAMMLDLARHFSQMGTQPPCNLLFIAFGAEEAGLIGSRYYVTHPLVPLEKMALLINLDLTSTGEDGIMVVNGRVFKPLVAKMQAINQQQKLVKTIKKRPKAANSDHYWFSEKGVKAVFIYLLGEYPYYHDVHDTPEKPNWKGYEGTFQLIAQLVQSW